MKTKLKVSGNEVELDLIRRRSETETWAFLQVPKRPFRKAIVYGVSYDVEKQEINDIAKFRDKIFGRNHFWDERPSYSVYGELVLKCDPEYYIRGEYSGFHPLDQRKSFIRVDTIKEDSRIRPLGKKGQGQLTDLTREPPKKIDSSERADLELILEELRTSHLDFSVMGDVYDRTALEFEVVSENKNRIVETATIYHPLETRITRDIPKSDISTGRPYPNGAVSLYRSLPPKYTYVFHNDKRFESIYEPCILPLQNPQVGKPCFVHDMNGGSTFLDEEGNTLGTATFWPDSLRAYRGTCKNDRGEEIPYSFVTNHGTKFVLLDDNGNAVGSLGSGGFVHGNPSSK